MKTLKAIHGDDNIFSILKSYSLNDIAYHKRVITYISYMRHEDLLQGIQHT